MNEKQPPLQDLFLNTLRKEHIAVSIYLVNGIKLLGVIESFDAYVVLLKNEITQMVYKHAISTIFPSRPVSMQSDERQSASAPQQAEPTAAAAHIAVKRPRRALARTDG